MFMFVCRNISMILEGLLKNYEKTDRPKDKGEKSKRQRCSNQFSCCFHFIFGFWEKMDLTFIFKPHYLVSCWFRNAIITYSSKVNSRPSESICSFGPWAPSPRLIWWFESNNLCRWNYFFSPSFSLHHSKNLPVFCLVLLHGLLLPPILERQAPQFQGSLQKNH